MSAASRLSTGVAGLDDLLGGGLIPGTLTVVVGASGIGKTQLGVQFANAGQAQERRRGILFDLTARIDSQSHAAYAERMCDWRLSPVDASQHPKIEGFFSADRAHGDYLHVFHERGQRVTQRDLGYDAWHDWQAELASKLAVTIGFFYGNFMTGVRRAVLDGIEPADRPSESIQFELLEYIYHQILRKDSDWVARDLLRQDFRANAENVAAHQYDYKQVGCLALVTSHEMMLDPLIDRPLVDGDLLANANTLIYLGKIREGTKFGRGMFIAKHRGSACSDEVIRYTIDDRGLQLC